MICSGILIYTPCYQQNIKSPAAGSIYAVGQMLAWNKIPNQWLAFSASDITDSRNMMLTLWYDSHPKFSHFLMVDSDMQFPPQVVVDMLKFDRPLMGAVYARRELPPAMVGMCLEDGTLPVRDGFARVKYVGGGCTMIRRDVVTEILKKFPECNDCSDVGRLSSLGITRILRVFDKMKSLENQALSEDYALCERWRQCGGEVWASIDHTINHIGDFNYAVQGREMLLGKVSEAA